MSRLTRTLLLLGLTAHQVSAQDPVVSRPFRLKLSSDDSTFDGVFLSTIHSGAGANQLVMTDKNPTVTEFNTFTFNTNAGDTTGTIGWEAATVNGKKQTGLTLQTSLTSNVALGLFQPQGFSTFTTFGFDADNKLYVPSPVYDETTFEAGKTPSTTPSKPLYRLHMCWTLYTTYYYRTLTWVTAGEPINPTCKAVTVIRDFV